MAMKETIWFTIVLTFFLTSLYFFKNPISKVISLEHESELCDVKNVEDGKKCTYHTNNNITNINHDKKILHSISKNNSIENLKNISNVHYDEKTLQNGSTKPQMKSTEKVINVYYNRIRKTASSTTAHLLFRFAYNNNLNIVPFRECGFSNSKLANCLTEIPQKKLTYNIFAQHLFYDYDSVLSVMPENTFQVTSIRHPFRHLASLLRQFNIEFKMLDHIDIHNKKQPQIEFLENIDKMKEKKEANMRIRNYASRTLGLNPKQQNDPEYIKNFLSNLDTQLDFVIVDEYYDESLVLLKRKLNWNIKDIIYLRLNDQKYKDENIIPTSKYSNIYRNYSNADYMLYEHYLSLLFQKISKEKNFYSEVYYFRQINLKLDKFCLDNMNKNHINANYIKKILSDEVSMKISDNPWGEDFTVYAWECAIDKMDITYLRNALIVKQMPELCSMKLNKMKGPYHEIVISKNRVTLWPGYCKNIIPPHNLSQDLMTVKEIYKHIKMKE